MSKERGEETSVDLKTEIDLKTRERIHHPVVKDLYGAYVKAGIFDELVSLVDRIPPGYQEPVKHTLFTHVTKEKPIFIYILSPQSSKLDGSAKTLSAGVDLLWCASLIYDDLVDQDRERSGKKAAWVEFGQEKTLASISAVLDTMRTRLNGVFGENSFDQCLHYVNRGIFSIEEHKLMDISVSSDELISNYAKRAEFHTTFPLSLIYKDGDKRKERALLAIGDLNIAGQILNDIKDFLPDYAWNREGLSDVRNGLVTLPIKHLWERMIPGQQEIFKDIFGKKNLSEEEVRFVVEAVKNTGALESVSGVVRRYFAASLDNFREAVDGSEVQFPVDWINYKLTQLPKPM